MAFSVASQLEKLEMNSRGTDTAGMLEARWIGLDYLRLDMVDFRMETTVAKFTMILSRSSDFGCPCLWFWFPSLNMCEGCR